MYDRVKTVRVNQNHGRGYISYLDMVEGVGCVCAWVVHKIAVVYISIVVNFFYGRIKSCDMDYLDTQIRDSKSNLNCDYTFMPRGESFFDSRGNFFSLFVQTD